MPKYVLFNEESERLLFKEVRPSDFENWLPFHEEPLSSQYWSGLPTDPKVACQQQFARIFERYKEDLGGMNALFLKDNKTLVGLCGVLIQEVNKKEEFEIGYSILPTYWRQGLAFEAAEKCKQVAFKKEWANSLISIIQVDNIPSQKTAIKNGMYLDFTTTYHNNEVHIFRINA
ncbi:GNAT family N-acetyltransferase [Maribacter hydrothermalis]|uniref:GNAT family acetyltransferase n=1 Tax=Maribacter hydrothermalis TaxID=1836467 RepID=A0A1B7Z195_9FLAO|nr:GNAT family N-acetyltransferase [Maribacter hydrothermalis]APQ18108.1 GNAT family N-acetyltransferase [Maribacter hydrothermalis]OBR36454.1 GNAT family acetyltransferase [Maribacter hydrothermalis]